MISLEYIKEVLGNGEAKNNIILMEWNKATGKQRLEFIIMICSRYRGLIKEVLKRIEERLHEKK